MMTALLAARNILGLGNFDTWKVNTDAEYHEGSKARQSQGRKRPQPSPHRVSVPETRPLICGRRPPPIQNSKSKIENGFRIDVCHAVRLAFRA